VRHAVAALFGLLRAPFSELAPGAAAVLSAKASSLEALIAAPGKLASCALSLLAIIRLATPAGRPFGPGLARLAEGLASAAHLLPSAGAVVVVIVIPLLVFLVRVVVLVFLVVIFLFLFLLRLRIILLPLRRLRRLRHVLLVLVIPEGLQRVLLQLLQHDGTCST